MNFLRVTPLQSNLTIQNLREIMLSKREVIDLDFLESLSITELIEVSLKRTHRIDIEKTAGRLAP